MAADLSDKIRLEVAARAGHRCEYCLIREPDTGFPLEVDHIISRKHGGRSDPDNLAYACVRCNAWKGADVGSIATASGGYVSLFHPRRQRWEDHFVLRGAVIEPVTAEAEATVRLLKLNIEKRVVERQLLVALGRYPR